MATTVLCGLRQQHSVNFHLPVLLSSRRAAAGAFAPKSSSSTSSTLTSADSTRRRGGLKPSSSSSSSSSGSETSSFLSSSLPPFASVYHAPVMWKEVLEWLITDPQGTYLDCTLGGGGHSEAILSKLEGKGQLIALDQDPDALAFATKRLEKQAEEGRFRPLRANFRSAYEVIQQEGAMPTEGFAGMLLDLGVSSHQLDEASRGFSFRGDGPLDMRMQGPENSGLSADGLVNKWDVSDLSKVLKEYGEEPKAYRIARAIVSSRPVASTTQLREIIEKHCPYIDRGKTLARVFQGLRIAVNGEMDALTAVLEQSTKLVKKGGRLVVLSYHSLEDRPVKRFLRSGNIAGKEYKDFYGHALSTWRPLSRQSMRPTEEEVAVNARARSVSMRVAERTEWSDEEVMGKAGGPPASGVDDLMRERRKGAGDSGKGRRKRGR